MTDQDKRTLSERIATLAEAAGIAPELLWEPAETCPQGHPAPSSTHKVGTLCYRCALEGFRSEDLVDGKSYTDYQYQIWQHQYNPDYHPEWRIQPVPKDFTKPGNLEPFAERLLDVWNAETAKKYYVFTHTFFPNAGTATHSVQIADYFGDTTVVGYGEGMSYEVALGEALLDAAERIVHDA